MRSAAERFQLLLVEQQLPDMGVLAFSGELQRLAAPLIVLTDEREEDSAVAAPRLGASEYLVKRQ